MIQGSTVYVSHIYHVVIEFWCIVLTFSQHVTRGLRNSTILYCTSYHFNSVL